MHSHGFWQDAYQIWLISSAIGEGRIKFSGDGKYVMANTCVRGDGSLNCQKIVLMSNIAKGVIAGSGMHSVNSDEENGQGKDKFNFLTTKILSDISYFIAPLPDMNGRHGYMIESVRNDPGALFGVITEDLPEAVKGQLHKVPLKEIDGLIARQFQDNRKIDYFAVKPMTEYNLLKKDIFRDHFINAVKMIPMSKNTMALIRQYIISTRQ
jgi:hypothetical protein